MERLTHTCGAQLWRHEAGGVAAVVIYGDDDQQEIYVCPGCGASLADSELTPASATTIKRGGRRPGAGRTIVDVQLDLEAGKSLKVLILSRGLPYTRENCDRLAAALIEAEWRKLDAEYGRLAETTDD